ncbi:MAG TPA: cupin domain-containing protein [Nevskiales bacterium]|nr:cupin domain-containing protein [Nevskiales bacterium]
MHAHTQSHRFAHAVLGASLLSLLASASAVAGTCPPDKIGKNALAGAPTMPSGVTDRELASIDLTKEKVKLNQRRLRLRHMTIQPGGVVPLHSHADRPALIMVDSGELYEYSSQCREPLLHKAGDISREAQGTLHWWKNTGTAPVELTIADIVNDGKPDPRKDGM